MSKIIINDRELLKLVDAGVSQAETARQLGVTRQAVSKRLKELRGRTTRVLVAKETDKVIEQSFDAVTQLTDINRKTLELLDQAETDQELSLKCVAELRNQIKLAMEIQERIYSQQAAREFMTIIIDVLRDVSHDAYKEFKTRINDHRTLRSTLRIS